MTWGALTESCEYKVIAYPSRPVLADGWGYMNLIDWRFVGKGRAGAEALRRLAKCHIIRRGGRYMTFKNKNIAYLKACESGLSDAQREARVIIVVKDNHLENLPDKRNFSLRNNENPDRVMSRARIQVYYKKQGWWTW